MNIPYRPMTRILASGLVAAPLALLPAFASADESAEIRFATPSWPGVTVKTQLAAELLTALGYEPSQQEIGATIAYEALNLNEVDAFMAAWLPAQQPMYDASMEKDTLVDLGNNVDGALIGFAVPRYVAEAGVKQVGDLDKPEFADKFGREIFSIEVGSGMSDTLNEAIDNDTYGLGDWKPVETSTPGMLSAVKNAISNDEWIVFAGWTPHWMNIEYDVVYLEDTEDMWGPDGGGSDVRTLLNKPYSEAHPNATRLLDQLTFSADDQSAMIYEFSFEERDPDEVAIEWINQHPDRIEAFVDGVTTIDGEPAWPALQEAFDFES